MVQVAKEPIGTKGARLTSHVSLPGRNLVLIPFMDHVGVSRRIEDEAERTRLKDIIEALRTDNMGFIVRTAADGKDRDSLASDVEYLTDLWQAIYRKYKTGRAPAPLHTDLPITLRAVRDLFNADIDRVVIDAPEEYEKIVSFFGKHMPMMNCAIELYEGGEPIFDHYGLEVEIARALQAKVWLKSGGYVVLEQTEALTAIDVNTGRYVGKHNLEDTILKTNLEAVKEICYQLRLRNIGGLIIIDFIDMEKEANREKVFAALQEQLTKDRAKTNILKISELGLVEMTRKRTRESIARLLSEPCPYCDGKGYVKSRTSICAEIFREIKKESKNAAGKSLILYVHPDIADLLYEEERPGLELLEQTCGKRITIKDNSSFHIEQFEIVFT
jgi:ribonuclease G